MTSLQRKFYTKNAFQVKDRHSVSSKPVEYDYTFLQQENVFRTQLEPPDFGPKSELIEKINE